MGIKRMPGDEVMREIFSCKLQLLLDDRKVSQAELSRIVGVSESAVGKWILKKAMPRMGVIQNLADYFGVNKSYFLEETPKDNKNTSKEDPFPDVTPEERAALLNVLAILRADPDLKK